MKSQSPEWRKRWRAPLTGRWFRSVCNPKHIIEPSDWVTLSPRLFTASKMNGNLLFSLLKWQLQNIKCQLKRRQAQLKEWHLILISVIEGGKMTEGWLWTVDLAILLPSGIKRERQSTGANRSHIKAAAGLNHKWKVYHSWWQIQMNRTVCVHMDVCSSVTISYIVI